MAQLSRRRVLQLSGGGAVAAGASGLASIFLPARAPALAKGTTVHWLKFVDFVPGSDELIKGKLKDECKKVLGIDLTVETVDGNGIQARTTSAIQSGSGPDIIMEINNWAQLYVESVIEVSDIAEEIGQAQGGYYETARTVAIDGDKWIAIPHTIVPNLLVNRTSWFADVGVTPENFPQTWDEYRELGKKLKLKDRPYGQTLAHTFGDAPNFWYPYLWSWGGKEVEADGKTVVLNSQATIDSVKYAVPFWRDCVDEGGLAWDDSSNNRAFLSGSISATNNGASIYLEAKKKPDTYQTEKGTPMWQDILHAPLPKGAGGQFNLPGSFTNMLMGYSKNQKAAKDFLRWVSSKPVFEQWFTSQQGYTDGATRYWEEDAVWGKDPVLLPFRDIPNKGRLMGYAGPPGRASAEAQTKYIIVDMYAKAVQGMAPEDAVKWAHSELVKIYA